MKTKILSTALLITVFMFVNCNDDDNDPQILMNASITTDESSYSNTFTTLEISGQINTSLNQVSEKGLCWNTSPNATVNDNKMTASSNNFTLNVENLTANTVYYFRAYATEAGQTVYSTEKAFSTSSLADTDWLAQFGYTQNQTVIDAIFSFYSDGTTKYDEVDFPDIFTEYGQWSLTGNIVTYQMSNNMPNDYIFTGELFENTMSGTFIFGAYNDNWFTAELIE